MKSIKYFVFGAVIIVAPFSLNAVEQATPEKYSFQNQGKERTYTISLPNNYNEHTPVIVYAHGYNSKKRWVPTLNKAANEIGWAVVYPDGLPDAKGKDGWNVGYPGQEVMTVDEGQFFSSLLDEVSDRFGLSREDVYLTGMSNGGDLCYKFMYTAPDIFKAYASVAGLAFENYYIPNQLTSAKPFMEIHGNADTTSRWEGDHENKDGWGAYIPVPLAVAGIALHNKCCKTETDTIPSKTDPERPVIRTCYGESKQNAPVILYEISGGKHSWGEKDVDTSKIIVDFFLKTQNQVKE